MDQHTFACRRRERLARAVLRYLKDLKEGENRARITTAIGRALERDELMTLFLEYTRVQASVVLGVHDVVANIVAHRTVTDSGEFDLIMEMCEQAMRMEIVADQGTLDALAGSPGAEYASQREALAAIRAAVRGIEADGGTFREEDLPVRERQAFASLRKGLLKDGTVYRPTKDTFRFTAGSP